MHVINKLNKLLQYSTPNSKLRRNNPKGRTKQEL